MGRDEALQRHHQQRGVEDLGVVVLGERADLGVPAALHDLVVDGVAFGHPAGEVGGPAALGRQPDRAVQRDPGLEPAVGEVLLAAAGLPDPLVGLVPVLAQPVDDAGQRRPALVAGLHAAAVGQVDGVGGLAVDVELELVGGAVADPDRPRAAPALEVVQALLDQVRGAVDPVHDLQRARVLARLLLHPVPQPDAERGGLLHVAQAQQRVDGEGAVPDPGVAVVPVALAAGLLGQAGGRRRHRRPGRVIGHQLQRHGRTGDHLPPPAGVGRPVQPAAPEPRRVVGQPLGLLGRDLARRAAHGLQHHAADLALAQGAGPAQPVTGALRRDPRFRQRRTPPARCRAWSAACHRRRTPRRARTVPACAACGRSRSAAGSRSRTA